MTELFSQAQLPEGFHYPQRLIEIAQNNEQLGSGTWWIIHETPDYAMLCLELTQRTSPGKPLIPFAKSDDENILACFDGEDTSDNPRVYFDIFKDVSIVNWEHRYSVLFTEWLSEAQST
jgi:hypothetical protein